MTKRYRAQLLVGTLLAGMTVATPAFAQTQDQTNQSPSTNSGLQPVENRATDAVDSGDIVVTGTLIRNPNLTSSTPVSSIGDAEILKRVPNNAEELLRSVPGVSPGVGAQVNNGSNGTNSVDLRGLGVQRNIVLLDSNRIVPSLAGGAVDLNVIPLALVQRVDVLTGGASTTYGADAVSGVVNFITRKNFSGLDVRASYRLNEEGDGRAFRGDITLGGNFADDRGNAVVSVGYTDVAPIYQTRPFALFGINSRTGRASGSSPTGVPTAFDFGGTDEFVQLNPTSTALIPQYQGFNFNPYNIFQTPLKRKSAYAALNYEVADGIEVYSRGLYANNVISSIIAPSGLFGAELTIPANNPFLTPAIRDQICGFNDIPLGATCDTNPALPLPGVYRRLVEIGPRISEYQNTVYDVRGGARFDITQNLNLDLSAAYGRAEQRETRSGYVLTSRVQQALNATNATSCTITTNNCVPLNLFGPAGSITPAQANFLAGQSSVAIDTELMQYRGLLSGDLGMTFPGAPAPVSFALGAEHRKYNFDRRPDAAAQNPSELGGAGGATLPFQGSYRVVEGFGELIAPIFADRPGFESLTLEAGVRYSKYNVEAPGNPSFDAWTYKGGLKWEPFDGLSFRTNYQRAVRAPNISELFAPTTTGLTNLTSDPCAGTAPTTNATLAAVCIAQGAPAALVNAGTVQDPAAGQANATFVSNTNIKPERADTFTAGVVFTPRDFIRNLTFTVDFYDIRVNNAITYATPGDAISACFNAPSLTSAACQSIRRNPINGRLSGSTATTPGLRLPLSNTGRLETRGVDFTANYKLQAGMAGIELNFAGNYTDRLRFQSAPTTYNRDCVGLYSANCGPSLGQIMPKFSFQQRTTLNLAPLSLSLLWRHIDPVRYEGSEADFAARGFTAANRALFRGTITNAPGANSALAGQTVDFNRIKAYDYFDLSAQFEFEKRYTLTFQATNLFNRKPPVVGGEAGTTAANSGNTYPSTYDPLGRSYSVSIRTTF